jgi:hypothetical protein
MEMRLRQGTRSKLRTNISLIYAMDTIRFIRRLLRKKRLVFIKRVNFCPTFKL